MSYDDNYLNEDEYNQEIDKIKNTFDFNKISKNKYEELTDQKIYSIDSEDTLEIDDAISLEKKDNFRILWIHVALIAELIPINSILESIALKKASTDYKSENTIYMFPEELIRKYLSLNNKEKRFALSAKIQLNGDHCIERYEIKKTIIKPTYKLTYEDTDEILELQPREELELIEINNILIEFRKRRELQGALFIENPQGNIIKENNCLELKIRENTQAKRLVSESMILYGSLMAEYCACNGIDIPYRNQTINRKCNIESRNTKSEYISNYIKRSTLSPTTIDIEPLGHHSLGLNYYTHITSPIRRYIDFLTQHQIVSNLNNTETMTRETLLYKIEQYKVNIKENLSRQREYKRELLLEWFEYNKTKKWDILFLRWLIKSKSVALIHFKDLYLDLNCFLISNQNLLLGDLITIKLVEINSKNSALKFEALL